MAEEKGTQRPIYPAEIGRFDRRLRETIGDESVRSFASRAKQSEATVRNYLAGTRIPALDRLALLARAGGVSVEWLATGDPDAQRSVGEPRGAYGNDGLVAEIVEAAVVLTEKWIRKNKAERPAPDHYGVIVRVVCEEIADRGLDQAERIVDRILRVAQPDWPR